MRHRGDSRVVVGREQLGDRPAVVPQERVGRGPVARRRTRRAPAARPRVVAAQLAEPVQQPVGPVLRSRFDAVAQQRVQRRTGEVAEIGVEVPADLVRVELVDLQAGRCGRSGAVGLAGERGAEPQDPPAAGRRVPVQRPARPHAAVTSIAPRRIEGRAGSSARRRARSSRGAAPKPALTSAWRPGRPASSANSDIPNSDMRPQHRRQRTPGEPAGQSGGRAVGGQHQPETGARSPARRRRSGPARSWPSRSATRR